MKRKKKRQEKQAASKRVNPFQLLYCRKHAGLSRADLAEAVDLPESTIRKLECVDVDELPRSYRDFKYLSSDKLDAIEARLKCAGQLAAVPNQPVTSEIIQYYERYRFDDPDMPETFFPAQRVVPKMIVFDFDGTLTERAEVNVWERLWLQLGYSQNDCANLAMEFFRKHITHEEWCNKTLIYFRDKKLTEAMVREIAADVKLIDGFGPTIQLLKENGIKLYITSGSVFTIISEALGDYLDCNRSYAPDCLRGGGNVFVSACQW